MKHGIFLAAVLAMASTGPAWARADCPHTSDGAAPIEDARLYIEDNVPDRDVGVHGFFGDTAWRILCVFSPDGTKILAMEPDGPLGELGMAEFVFESNEPIYEDWGFEALQKTFPEGEYAVRAINTDGSLVAGAARFTTVVALAPDILHPETSRDENGDLPVVPLDDLAVRWAPSPGSKDGRSITIAGYQVILTHTDWQGSTDGFAKPFFSVHLPPDRTELVVPRGFFDPETVYELEIITIEDSGNQTIAGVSFFETGR